MNKISLNSSTVITNFGTLTILFICLKLVNVITWSWLLVLSPILIIVGLTLLIILIEFITYITN